jgi:hypothetical protein
MILDPTGKNRRLADRGEKFTTAKLLTIQGKRVVYPTEFVPAPGFGRSVLRD